ncbi:MAG: T9SS type A sorting domain-containing protein, partial [Bacteroidota bacterium]
NNNELDSFPIPDTTIIDKLPEPDTLLYNCFGLENNPYGYWIGTDSVPSLISRGFWEYTQIIKVQDTIAPTIIVEDTVSFCINRSDCEADVVVSFAIIDECVDGNVRIRTYIEDGNPANESVEYSEDPWDIVGRYPKYLMSGIVPEGSYRIEIEADDQCGNLARVSYILEVVDCKPPPLVCRDGLVVELMPQVPGTDADGDGDIDAGANFVWATDFLSRMIDDDCNGPVDYSINRKGELPDRSRKGLTLTCDDPEILEIEIYAWDNADNPFSIQPDGTPGGANFDFCKNFVEVQDNNGICEPIGGVDIAGKIVRPQGNVMSDVEVRLSGASSRQVMTNNNGDYYMQGLEEGHDYSIFPKKTTDLAQGITTLDIIYMTKHILGVDPFEDPYQYLAADLNRSRSVSTLDVILLRKAILNIDQTSMDLAGWRFIDATHRFDDPRNPWSRAVPEVISLNNIEFDQGDLDFIAIKMGDVSGLVTPRSKIGPLNSLLAEDALLEAGAQVRVPVRLESLRALEGLQFGLQIRSDLAKLSHFENAQFAANQVNWQKEKQQVLFSWDRYQSGGADLSTEPLFYLDLVLKKPALLSEIISVDKRLLSPESYGNSQISTLDFKWTKSSHSNLEAKVFPNPFQNELNVAIGKGWDRQVPIQIELYGIDGKLIVQRSLTSSDWDADLINLQMGNTLEPGLYLLKVRQQHKTLNFKVLH